MSGPDTLELDPAGMQALIDGVMPRLREAQQHLVEGPVDTSGLADASFLQALIEDVPQQGTDLNALLDLLLEQCLPRSLNATAPGFMGYVPGGGLFSSAVADLIADTLNRYVGVSEVSGGFAQLEANVIRWFCSLMGMPDSAAGFLTSGGSLANWSAVVTARAHQLGESFAKGVIYTSSQAHHCVAKAARLAGIAAANLRVLDVDECYRLQPDVVSRAVAEDRARGLRPFMLVASAGTTNTGAVDPLATLADLCAEENLWLHVDGAYGGFFRLTENGRDVLKGIERADSIALDPHKTLFLPYGTGALLVRDRAHLQQIHGASADYLPDTSADDAVMDFCDLSPELTRPFRGLRVWLPLKMYGLDVFRRYLDEKLALTQMLADELDRLPQIELVAPPQLSILAFAVAAAGSDLSARNERTRALMNRINARQRVMLTGTLLDGLFVIRVAIVAYRTHETQVRHLLEDLQAELTA